MRKSCYTRNSSGRLELRCPQCHEELNPADVENYSCCPFCNALLPQDDDMEDFVLDPVISHWLRKNPLNSCGR